MSSKLLAGKAATSPLSVANRVPDGPTSETQNAANDAGQQLKPENMGSVLQQFTSIASSAPQAASSAIQAPANMLMQAPQQLASAPQQLSSMLSQFAGGFGSDLAQQGAALPAGSPAPARSRVSTRPE
jgi:hypothetical protein